jgi:hypothetical protein
MFQELPQWHTNRLLTANRDAVIYPQRRHTPPPSSPIIWHPTSFIEEHWSRLIDVVIRYYTRDTDKMRDAQIRIKENGEGFWMQVRACRKTALESNWRWKEIRHTELTPLTACQQNKDYPWIIIGGKQDVGRYCKALSCPKLAEDAETTDVWFTVALAQIEMQGDQRATVIEDPMQEQRIRQGDLGVVFRTLRERQGEPIVYEGVRATRKRKNILSGEAGEAGEAGSEVQVEAESEGSAAKRRRLADVGGPNELEMAGPAEPDIESVMDSEVEPNRECVVDGAVGQNLQSIVHTEAEGNEMQEGKTPENSEDIAAGSQ